jgi:signal transduction histidine kinase
LRLEPTDVREIISDGVSQVTPIARSKQQLIKIEAPDRLPLVNVDRAAMVKVLINLVDNACKYSPKDGLVTVEATADGGFVTVSVCDTGPGIPPERREEIFAGYYQVRDLRRNEPETGVAGSGLGLAICKSIVEMHGGRIWLEEQRGPGACFAFTLPIASAGTSGVHEPSRPATVGPRG